MTPTTLGWLALNALIFSTLWLIFLITGIASTGPVNTFDDLLAQINSGGVIYQFTYINAALVTLIVTALMAGLYEFTKRDTEWALIGSIFTPVYCAINLFIYLSQITIVPTLLRAWHASPGGDQTAYLLLSHMVQQ
jgi:hypothetical protein